MTFLELQDGVMARLNLTTDDARERISDFLNQRLRAVQTSCNLGRVRRGSRSYTLTAADPYLTTGGTPGDLTEPEVLKVLNVRIPALDRTLGEVSEQAITDQDPNESQSSPPLVYAVVAVNATNVTLRFFPVPNEETVITVEGILTGVDMAADADVPTIPEDFHDILLYGAWAEEFGHQDKIDRQNFYEKKYETRLGELRYFIQKSRRLSRQGQRYAYPTWLWAYGAPWYVAP